LEESAVSIFRVQEETPKRREGFSEKLVNIRLYMRWAGHITRMGEKRNA
jgi:hypothetical protein